jgi:hypothetical protein
LENAAEFDRELVALAESVPAGQLGQLLALANRVGSTALAEYADRVAVQLEEVVVDYDADARERIDAARQLVQLMPESGEAASIVVEAIDLQMSPRTAEGLIAALGESRAENLAEVILEAAGTWTPAVRESAIRLLLSRPAWTKGLIIALENQRVRMSDLALDQRQALARHPDREVRDAATALMEAGGGLPNADRVAVIERYHEAVTGRGDIERGRALFKEHCSKCHRHGEMGVEIGPELTGMAVHPKEELLVHILDPSRSVEGNFRSYSVLTVEGRVLTGMLAGESRTTIELVDTQGKRETLPRADIDQLAASDKSVMPEGFENQISVSQMTDLLEFLTARGKYLPVDLRSAATLPSDRPMFYGGSGEVLELADWSMRKVGEVPFTLIRPAEGRVANVIMLYGPNGRVPPTLPRQVEFPVNAPARAIHMLGGVGGWNAKQPIEDGPAVMTVRLHYADGEREEHVLRDGVHFADYIGPFEVPESSLAFELRRGFQMRYLTLLPERPEAVIEKIELIKNDHPSSPITMAVTIESP